MVRRKGRIEALGLRVPDQIGTKEESEISRSDRSLA